MKQRISNRIIQFSLQQCRFGQLLVASSEKGICAAFPTMQEQMALEKLQKQFPASICLQQEVEIHRQFILGIDKNADFPPFDVCGTSFQVKVWRNIQQLKRGETSTYRSIAQQIGHPNACRAVGTALASNRIFYGIPCHRVISTNGKPGGFKWGLELKIRILNDEINSII